jgi:hypothetical protein
MLPLDNYPSMYSGIFKNFYIFKYDYCGMLSDGKTKTDYFKVITLQHSNEILTMYPVSNDFKTPFIDITPIQEEDCSNKLVKRMSQIDKFNQRYGKMIDKK